MINMPIGAALGLSVVFVSLAVAAPAEASYRIRNKVNTNQCLGLPASNVTNGTNIITYQCDGTPNQDWYHKYYNGAWHWKNGANQNKCLTAFYGVGFQVTIWDCDTNGSAGQDSYQGWDTEDGGGGYVYLIPNVLASLNYVAGVAGGNANVKNGGSLYMWERLAGHDDQLWLFDGF